MGTISAKTNPSKAQVGLENLLYQNLETELGGVQIYTNAIRLAIDEGLRSEWEKYLAETERHVEVARGLLKTAGLDPDAEVPARLPVRLIGETLVQAMMKSTAAGDPQAAQITAAECVVLAETKDHSNWELIGMIAREVGGDLGAALTAAHQEVEEQEDHHLYHTAGWARELRVQSLGLAPVLPPPEEEQNVASAIAAARAKKSREKRPS
jgi:hypothetical protein